MLLRDSLLRRLAVRHVELQFLRRCARHTRRAHGAGRKVNSLRRAIRFHPPHPRAISLAEVDAGGVESLARPPCNRDSLSSLTPPQFDVRAPHTLIPDYSRPNRSPKCKRGSHQDFASLARWALIAHACVRTSLAMNNLGECPWTPGDAAAMIRGATRTTNSRRWTWLLTVLSMTIRPKARVFPSATLIVLCMLVTEIEVRGATGRTGS